MNAKQFLKMIVKMLREHCPKSRTWPHKRVLNWVAWFAVSGRLRVIMEGSNIIGVGMWRYLNDINKHCNWEHHDNNGSIIWFDYVYSENFSVLLRLWNYATCGKKLKKLAYLRVKKNDELCVLNLNHRGS